MAETKSNRQSAGLPPPPAPLSPPNHDEMPVGANIVPQDDSKNRVAAAGEGKPIDRDVEADEAAEKKAVEGAAKGMLEVKALRDGFYGNERISEGQVFHIKKQAHEGSWMEYTDKGQEKAHQKRMKEAKEERRKKAKGEDAE